MYNALSTDNLVRQFVDSKLQESIQVTASLDSEGKLRPNIAVQFDKETSAPSSTISNKTGCYQYTYNKDGSRYVGKASQFNDRHKGHKDAVRNESSEFHRFVKTNGGWSVFSWGTLYITPSFLYDFKILYPFYQLSKGEVMFLAHITQLYPGILEQSLITGTTPELNKDDTVYFVYTHWNNEWLKQNAPRDPKAKQVVVYNTISVEPIIGPYSIANITDILGVSKDIVPRYLNSPRFFESPKLGIFVRVQELGATRPFFYYKKREVKRKILFIEL